MTIVEENTNEEFLERETGFEPATFCLGSKHSTTELLAHPRYSSFKLISCKEYALRHNNSYRK